jgi:thiamine biosynthesis protein ThiS
MSMKIVVNGVDADTAGGTTVRGLLAERMVKMPEMVSVEHNGRILRREEFDTVVLAAGDRIEFLYFMGGGGLTEGQIERYSRQIILDGVGGAGQEKLLAAKVLIVGAGGLGSPAALYLAAAGVGTLGLVDADVVDVTNLQRQILHATPDVGTRKIDSARAKLAALNPDVAVRLHPERLTAANAAAILRDYDFVIDGTDNFPAKFLINDACVLGGKPFSHGGILRFDGQLMTVLPGQSACYRCVFPAPPPAGAVPSCSEAGVLGVLAGVIGTLQAAEALKFVLGKGDLLTDVLMTYDALRGEFRKVVVRRNPDCPVCSAHPAIRELRDEGEVACDVRGGTGASLAIPRPVREAMVAHAKADVPREACGLLAGRGSRAERYLRMTNTDASGVHFLMKPEEQFAATRDIRAAGEVLVGVFHSHPASPARPSAEDVRMALTPGVVHLILSLAFPQAPELRGFRIGDGTVSEVPLAAGEEDR